MPEAEVRKFVFEELRPIKERLNDAEKKLSDFAELLKSATDIDLTDLDIAQAESEQSITDLEIEVEELKESITPSNE